MQKLLFVAAAGLLGTLGRYWLSDWISRRIGDAFPTATLVVNITGCFLAGFLFYLLQERWPVSEELRTAIFVGFLGAFTTFSAIGLQTFMLLRDGDLTPAAIYLTASNLGGLLMIWGGYNLAKLV